MNRLRRLSALLLGIALVCTSAAASAASKSKGPSKTFTAEPVLQFKRVPSRAESQIANTIEINASLPGFLNMYLLDASGSVVMTLAKDMEIHSKVNSIDYSGFDDNGEPLDEGDYTVSIDMVSQFGVASKTVTKPMHVFPTTEYDDDGNAIPIASSKSSKKTTASSSKSTSSKTGTSATTGKTTGSSSSTQKTSTKNTAETKTVAVVSDEMEYEEGTFSMGDEGLMVGVGVSDVAEQKDAGYWSLTADAKDEEIWAALTRVMTSVDVGESESAYIYDSTEKNRKKIGTVSGLSQGLNLIKERDDGWSLVEAFRNEDGAFVRGYIKSDKLRTVEPNPTYGLVVDKAKQTLTVYKNGERLGSCLVSTGLPTPKYVHRETPAGEFVLVTRRGSYEYYGMGYTKCTIRFNGSYYISDMPTTKKNGTKFLDMPDELGSKATRGSICVSHNASNDGGINAEWIWKMTDENKKVKLLIFDDKPRADVPVSTK